MRQRAFLHLLRHPATPLHPSVDARRLRKKMAKSMQWMRQLLTSPQMLPLPVRRLFLRSMRCARYQFRDPMHSFSDFLSCETIHTLSSSSNHF